MRQRVIGSPELGVLNLPSKPTPGSWWLEKDREAFRQAVETQAARMRGSREAHASTPTYLTWDKFHK